ncbi:MAG TPA: septum formation initiator family protein [Nitriliruptorales bacterium]|nr:septum formation initiator family protein [Nitriliruptorales bacterium]
MVGAVTGVRSAGAVLGAGDRPFLLALAALIVIGALMVAAPLVRYLDGQDRLALLQRKAAALAAETARLEARERDLTSAEHVELLARERLGLVRPGEIPYVVVVPEADRPKVAMPTAGEPNRTDRWYRRLWEAVAGLVR